MNLKKNPPKALVFGGLVFALALTSLPPTARANVYATNIKVNGSLSGTEAAVGANVAISYILNEAATLGVSINIVSGSNVVRSLNLPAGGIGAAQGLNAVVWDGKNGSNQVVAAGTYAVSITAAATGYTNWTQTSSDTNAGNYIYSPQGIAVNVNTNSPYYGRVFVGTAANGPSPTTVPGDKDGIVKLNADGSFADEGQSSAGYNFFADGYFDLPQKMRYAMDDRLYFNDWTGSGKIVAVDMTMSTNQVVLDAPNYASNPYTATVNWFAVDVTDAGTTNARVWLGDAAYPSAGVWVWNITTNGYVSTDTTVDPNGTSGQWVIQTGGDLTLLPSGGVMVDASTNIFVAQNRANLNQLAPRAMVFTNWDGTTVLSSGACAWIVGQNDNTFANVYDTTISSRQNPKYVACAMTVGTSPGGIRILDATNGVAIVTNLSVGTGYRVTAWDNVGNLYAASSSISRWRVFSPPDGTNQATTKAVTKLVLVVPPRITGVAVAGGTATINFTGGASDTNSTFTVVSAGAAGGPYSPAAGASVSWISSGVFKATVPTNGATQFYRIRK
jgi:hypothetical protein